MILLSLLRGELAFGAEPLLDGVDLELARGERVALVGRNGAGKSSLLKLLAGEVQADGGRLEVAPGVRVSTLPQDVPAALSGPIEDLISAPLDRLGDADGELGPRRDQEDPERLVDETVSRLDLPAGERFENLSGGQKRRVLLARALIGSPGVLLLDEPTNHLDLPSIEWLQHLLRGYRGAVMFTTHDRRFLAEVASRIVELDRGALTSWPGDYANYLRRREERLAAEEQHHSRFDKRLAEEEVWIRQGIKARRTRNEGRVRRLQAMRKERSERREQPGQAKLRRQSVEGSGRRVIDARDLHIAFDGRTIVDGFSTLIMRGDRLGFIGPNGAGKTTLLRALIGESEPDSGEVILGTKLQIAYADQHRSPLDVEARVQDCVFDGSDHIVFNGERRHVIGYLQDFLFTAEQARGPVQALSGGERNRLLLARLFARPANLLVMDEPTNDLDIETLELLESLLMDYDGTLIVVSHDREFLDNVVTSIVAFGGPGDIREYVGGYSDWLRQHQGKPAVAAPSRSKTVKPAPAAKASGKKKFSYKESRELAALPEHIEALEERVEQLQGELADPALYQSGRGAVAEKESQLGLLESELGQAYERWSELEGRRD